MQVMPIRFPVGWPPIPLDALLPHEKTARRNLRRSLVELAITGISASDACAILEDRRWRAIGDTEAWSTLEKLFVRPEVSA